MSYRNHQLACTLSLGLKSPALEFARLLSTLAEAPPGIQTDAASFARRPGLEGAILGRPPFASCPEALLPSPDRCDTPALLLDRFLGFAGGAFALP